MLYCALQSIIFKELLADTLFHLNCSSRALPRYYTSSSSHPSDKMTTRKVISLDKDWVFKQADDDDEIVQFKPVAQFPTNVHLDLMHHGIIPDPFIGKNEDAVQWVGEKTWIYKTTFTSPSSFGSGTERAVLAFDGLDTYATVSLNNEEILRTEDMFIPERVDVTRLLQDAGQDNFLVITFESAFLIGKKTKENHPNHYWGCWNGDPSRLAVRKAQYHYVSFQKKQILFFSFVKSFKFYFYFNFILHYLTLDFL